MKHLLVTNDFPPKLGGIQSYLWELWRRLPPDETFVYTTPYAGAAQFDADQAYAVKRAKEFWLVPLPHIVRAIKAHADWLDVDLVILDPALPIGWCGPQLGRPYGVVLHGSEVTVPGRLPATRQALGRVLRGAELVICAGEYPAAEGRHAAGRDLPTVIIPPGVDRERFAPLASSARNAARLRFGFAPDDVVVLGLSRLVPRKGFDTVIEAMAKVAASHPRARLVIAGKGRDQERLERLARDCQSPVTFLGRVDDDELAQLYGASDLFAMCCRSRWGGLEQEGFGIVFLEAAAAGLAQVAGASGGSAEAVEHGVTGLVVDPPDHVARVAEAISRLVGDDDLRARMGRAARARAINQFDYNVLAAQLHQSIADTVLRLDRTNAP
jgi:phosphatidyl-myo-inositol dimannoside synthase